MASSAAAESRNAIEMTGMSSSKESKRGPSSSHNSKDGGAAGMSKRAPSYDASDEEAGLLGSKRPVGRHRIVPRSLREVGADNDGDGFDDSNRRNPSGGSSRSSSSKPTLEEQRIASRRAEVAMYASENFLNFVDFFQLFGLLWAIMFHVPWPTEWVMYTSWTLFANLDGSMYWFYHNYTASLNRSSGTPDPHFNLWGEIRGYGLLYSGIWTAVCLAFIVLVICIHSTKQSFHADKCWQRPVLRRFIQWSAYVFYLPFGIAFLRPFACSYSDFLGATVMDHDTTQECWRFEFTSDGFHGIACVIMGVVASVYLLYTPAWTIVHAKRHVVFEGRQRHEHFVQQKQCEYVLGINADFVNENMAYFSSFRQPMTSFRFIVFVRKLLLLLVYIFARTNIVTQLGLLWGVQLAWCITFTAFPPFRVRSSNIVMLVLDYTYLALGLLSLLRGGGTNSDAFVDSYFQIILVGVVGTGVGLALLVWLVDGAFLTCNPVQYRVDDPDAVTRHWVEEIRRVDQTLFALNSKPLELVDIDELRSELKSMFECFHEARENKHILRYTLQVHDACHRLDGVFLGLMSFHSDLPRACRFTFVSPLFLWLLTSVTTALTIFLRIAWRMCKPQLTSQKVWPCTLIQFYPVWSQSFAPKSSISQRSTRWCHHDLADGCESSRYATTFFLRLHLLLFTKCPFKSQTRTNH